MTDILELIDGAIEDWTTSDDAMRWTPEPDLTEPLPAWERDLLEGRWIVSLPFEENRFLDGSGGHIATWIDETHQFSLAEAHERIARMTPETDIRVGDNVRVWMNNQEITSMVESVTLERGRFGPDQAAVSTRIGFNGQIPGLFDVPIHVSALVPDGEVYLMRQPAIDYSVMPRLFEYEPGLNWSADLAGFRASWSYWPPIRRKAKRVRSQRIKQLRAAYRLRALARRRRNR